MIEQFSLYLRQELNRPSVNTVFCSLEGRHTFFSKLVMITLVHGVSYWNFLWCLVIFVIFPGTPVLGRKLTMRREVREALEVRRRSLQAERRKSQMQTLGAHNNVTRNPRISNAGVSVKDLFDGHSNPAYEHGDDDTNSLRLQNVARNWAELERVSNSHM